ncbi:CGNR zinc finger domain-containing protein [Streptomonospora wellingtoniae]|uniref:CGNR zinc finger domain-containing protein n=1 Tax=Streptomonospora wellingtoniae TaxID=3075544 RepID=A0ABU2KWQ1_9ACTN|nr:CGNR zinc finger domain-containing protein [Streptomonospora sp. DSM 45055]MDT0303726.1 CGNR zinc finger domain-containing protein [Streptomonospora sp. DSM 45055]
MVYTRPPAPGDLALVESFCNTAAFLRGTDALAEPEGARAWLGGQGFAAGGVEPGEAQRLRTVREAVRDHLQGREAGPARRRLSAESHTLLGPPRWRAQEPAPRLIGAAAEDAGGAEGLLAAVLAAVAAAEIGGRRDRLKVCAAPECRWVFYDRSPANSGSWCSMEICGARHKMRSYRTRRG